MGQKDLSQKELLQYPDVFADVINCLLFDGVNVLAEEELRPAETETLCLPSEWKLRSQISDVSKYRCVDSQIWEQYIIENQTKTDSRMVLRKIGYLGAIYRGMYEHKNTYPVFLIVLYWGKGVWKQKNSLIDLLEKSGYKGEALRYVEDLSVDVFEMANLPKEKRKKRLQCVNY